jgi:ribosome-associated protein
LTSQAQVIRTQLPNPPPPIEKLLETVHAAVEELKAKDVVEIDVRGKSSVTDFMIVASGTSSRHVKSIADEVVKFAKRLDVMPLGVEGEQEAEWVLVDLGDVVVHVMLPRVREFYGLEKLWEDSPPVEKVAVGAEPARAAPRKKTASRPRAAR